MEASFTEAVTTVTALKPLDTTLHGWYEITNMDLLKKRDWRVWNESV
jgi:hypothetical protein